MFTYWMLISIVVGALIFALALFCAYRQMFVRMLICLFFTIVFPVQMMIAEPGVTQSVPFFATNLIEYDDSEEAEAHRAKIMERAREAADADPYGAGGSEEQEDTGEGAPADLLHSILG